MDEIKGPVKEVWERTANEVANKQQRERKCPCTGLGGRPVVISEGGVWVACWVWIRTAANWRVNGWVKRGSLWIFCSFKHFSHWGKENVEAQLRRAGMSRGDFIDGLFLEWRGQMHVCGWPDTQKKERALRGVYIPFGFVGLLEKHTCAIASNHIKGDHKILRNVWCSDFQNFASISLKDFIYTYILLYIIYKICKIF